MDNSLKRLNEQQEITTDCLITELRALCVIFSDYNTQADVFITASKLFLQMRKRIARKDQYLGLCIADEKYCDTDAEKNLRDWYSETWNSLYSNVGSARFRPETTEEQANQLLEIESEAVNLFDKYLDQSQG